MNAANIVGYTVGALFVLFVLGYFSITAYVVGISITDSMVVISEVREPVEGGYIVHQERVDPWFNGLFYESDHTYIVQE